MDIVGSQHLFLTYLNQYTSIADNLSPAKLYTALFLFINTNSKKPDVFGSRQLFFR